MHLGFAAGLNVGRFSFNMIGYFPLLLTTEDWNLFVRLLSTSAGAAPRGDVPESSPLAFAWARVLSRVDGFARLRFVAADRWEVEDPATGKKSTGVGSWAECLSALPGGRPVALFVMLPGIRSLVSLAGRFVAAREGTWTRWFRLSAPTGAPPEIPRGPSPARRWLRRVPYTWARELTVVVLIYACTN